MSRQNVVQTIADGANKLKLLGALRPRRHHRRRPLQLQRQVAGKGRLDSHKPAPDVDRLELQAVLFKRTRAIGNPKVTGRTTQWVADFEFSQRFGLGDKERWK